MQSKDWIVLLVLDKGASDRNDWTTMDMKENQIDVNEKISHVQAKDN